MEQNFTGKIHTFGHSETKFYDTDQLRKSDIWITGEVQEHCVQGTLSLRFNHVFVQYIQLVLMQQTRLEEMNVSDQQLLCSKYEESATWLLGSSLDGRISTQFTYNTCSRFREVHASTFAST